MQQWNDCSFSEPISQKIKCYLVGAFLLLSMNGHATNDLECSGRTVGLSVNVSDFDDLFDGSAPNADDVENMIQVMATAQGNHVICDLEGFSTAIEIEDVQLEAATGATPGLNFVVSAELTINDDDPQPGAYRVGGMDSSTPGQEERLFTNTEIYDYLTDVATQLDDAGEQNSDENTIKLYDGLVYKVKAELAIPQKGETIEVWDGCRYDTAETGQPIVYVVKTTAQDDVNSTVAEVESVRYRPRGDSSDRTVNFSTP